MAQIVRFPDVLQKNPRTSTKSTRSPVHDLLSRQLGVAARARAPSAPASSAPRSSSDLLRASTASASPSRAVPLRRDGARGRAPPRLRPPPRTVPLHRASPDPASSSRAVSLRPASGLPCASAGRSVRRRAPLASLDLCPAAQGFDWPRHPGTSRTRRRALRLPLPAHQTARWLPLLLFRAAHPSSQRLSRGPARAARRWPQARARLG